MAQHVQHQPQHPAGSHYNPRLPPPPTHKAPYSTSSHGSGKSLSPSRPSTAVSAVPIFRAPAHKHAHHLHSIPPREKSTRTLIIDHMLWVHGRTRFAQARAELGMTDRTGGPSSTNYTHRRRPENYEEDDEEGSEGEQVEALKARGDPVHPSVDDEEERIGRQDLPLARNLRLRAEGLEKVVTSMLDQPPPVHPIPEDDFPTPPTSPRRESGSNARELHPHTLPNGVRLRLALGTVVNDLFARQAPPPPYRQQLQSSKTPASSASDQSPTENIDSRSHLPPALAALSPISAISKKSIRSLHEDSSYMEYSSSASELRPHIQDTPHFQNAPYPDAQPGPRTVPLVSIKPNDRVKDLYLAGADPSTANSPPALRCPRHLHTGCQICVEAKSPMKSTASSNTGSRGKSTSKAGESMSRRGAGSSLTANAARSSGAVAGSSKAGGGAISGWQDGTGIGSGLLRHGVKGNLLRRKNPDWVNPKSPQAGPEPGLGTSTAGMNGAGSGSTGGGAGKWTGSGNAKLSSLIPRFIRLSALAAMELGNEIKEAEEEDKQRQQQRDAQRQMQPPSSPVRRHPQRQEMNAAVGAYMTPPSTMPSRSTGGPSAASPARSTFNNNTNSGAAAAVDPSNSTDTSSIKAFEDALRPTREWYLLLAGLLTRAALEGYLTAGWQGYEAVECLLTVGLGHADVECEKRGARSRGSSSERTPSTGAGTGDGFDAAIRGHGRRHDDAGVIEEESGSEDSGSEEEDEALEDDEGDHHGSCREEEEFLEFEPDEMPSLHEAIKILFPGFCSSTNARTRQTTDRRESAGSSSIGVEIEKTEAEQEYEREMKSRLRRFYDIPDSTPDLSTHMEDLAWQFPAEPVERAAVRFCEAVARWRGKPELETYKQRPLPNFEPRQAATSMKPSAAPAATATPATPATPAQNAYAFHPLRPPSHYQQDPSIYAQYQQMPPPPLPLTPSSTNMTIESLIHSSPISPEVSTGTAAAGNVYPYHYHHLEEEEKERREQEAKERDAREEIERRKRLKKPSIESYFMVPEGWILSSASSTSSMGPIGGSGSLKRPRSPERIAPYAPVKRLHT